MKATLLKLGGELLESEQKLAAVARTIARAGTPLLIVHGGGREIDAALAAAGLARRQVDGLRVIRSGLTPTDRVVINGYQFAQPGAKAVTKAGKIVAAPAPKAAAASPEPVSAQATFAK